jgi:methionyl-tRNA synthetase
MPEKAAQLLDMLGVDISRRTFDDAKLGVDDSYGEPMLALGKGAWDALFPPLPVET